MHERDQIGWACAAQSTELLPKKNKPKGQFREQMRSSQSFSWPEKKKK